MASEKDIKSEIQEWMAEALDITDLAKTYATIICETEMQLGYVSEQLKQNIKSNNK